MTHADDVRLIRGDRPVGFNGELKPVAADELEGYGSSGDELSEAVDRAKTELRHLAALSGANMVVHFDYRTMVTNNLFYEVVAFGTPVVGTEFGRRPPPDRSWVEFETGLSNYAPGEPPREQQLD